MRQSSLGVIQRVEARYRLAVKSRFGEFGLVWLGWVMFGSPGEFRSVEAGPGLLWFVFVRQSR